MYAVYVSAGVSAEEAAALLQSVMPVLTLHASSDYYICCICVLRCVLRKQHTHLRTGAAYAKAAAFAAAFVARTPEVH